MREARLVEARCIGKEWQDEYQRKLVAAEEAVKVVKSGDRVIASFFGGRLLGEALAARVLADDGARRVEDGAGLDAVAEALAEQFGQAPVHLDGYHASGNLQQLLSERAGSRADFQDGCVFGNVGKFQQTAHEISVDEEALSAPASRRDSGGSEHLADFALGLQRPASCGKGRGRHSSISPWFGCFNSSRPVDKTP